LRNILAKQKHRGGNKKKRETVDSNTHNILFIMSVRKDETIYIMYIYFTCSEKGK